MKKIMREISGGVLCLLLMCPLYVQADDLAYFSVHRGNAVFRLKDDFQATADAYKLLLFAKTQYQNQDVWVEVYEEDQDKEGLVSEYGSRNGYIMNAPAVDKIALKLFEKRGGQWTDCFGLLESRMNLSKGSYEVTVSEAETGEQAQDALGCEDLYILEEADSTVLPLSLAEELYGPDANQIIETSGAEDGGGLFSGVSVLFCVQEKNGAGLLLREYGVKRSEESEEEQDKTDAGMNAAQATQTEQETQGGSRNQMGQETQPESESCTDQEIQTERREQQGQETQSESETQAVQGILLLLLVVAVFGFIFVIMRKRKSKKVNKACYMASDDDEDTFDPEKPAVTVKQINIDAGEAVIDGAVINHKGLVRANNEDNFYFNGKYLRRNEADKGASMTGRSKASIQLYAVCDGMGGADFGEEASCRAVEELARREADHERMMNPGELSATLRSISDKISVEAAQRNQKSGTTIAMMLVAAGQVIFANVGDSRIYRFRDQTLTQISVDHSRVQRMVSMGLLTPEQARTDPSRHIITQYLGMAGEIKISPYIVSDTKLLRDDIYILCSDGLTDMVEDSRIEAILRENRKPQAAAEVLFKTAMSHGGRDNVTIMVLRVCNT